MMSISINITTFPANDNIRNKSLQRRRVLRTQYLCRYKFSICNNSSNGICKSIYCQLLSCGWYWGALSVSEATDILMDQQNYVFLVRDSYHSRYIFCVSLHYRGRVLHLRMYTSNGLFSLDDKTFVPSTQIVAHCTTVTRQVFGTTVKLTTPLSRFARLDSLQRNCRYVIRQMVPEDTWNKLPLPPSLVSYVSSGRDYD